MKEHNPIAGLFTVQITVEGIRHSIQHCLMDYDKTIQASIDKEVENAVQKFDFSGQVNEAIKWELREMVNRIVRNSMTLLEDEFRKMVNSLLEKSLKEMSSCG